MRMVALAFASLGITPTGCLPAPCSQDVLRLGRDAELPQRIVLKAAAQVGDALPSYVCAATNKGGTVLVQCDERCSRTPTGDSATMAVTTSPLLLLPSP